MKSFCLSSLLIFSLKLFLHWQSFVAKNISKSFSCHAEANFTNIFSTKAGHNMPIFFMLFNGNSVWQKCAKILCLAQKSKPKTCSKFSAEILVKQSIFCAIYFKLASCALCKFVSEIDTWMHCLAPWTFDKNGNIKIYCQVAQGA